MTWRKHGFLFDDSVKIIYIVSVYSLSYWCYLCIHVLRKEGHCFLLSDKKEGRGSVIHLSRTE